MTVLHSLRRLAQQVGLDVRRVQPFSDRFETLVFLARKFDIGTIIDVGASYGEYAELLFEAGFSGKVVSFEPQPKAHAVLQNRARAYPQWTVAPRLALSNRAGTSTFNVAGNSSSSSLLRMTKRHVEVAPESQTTGAIDVELERLDNISRPLITDSSRILLKVDTQGTEKDVIEGCSAILDSIFIICTELSVETLYEQQPLMLDMFEYVQTLGFDLWDIEPVLRDSNTSRVLQYDATFVRRTHGFS